MKLIETLIEALSHPLENPVFTLTMILPDRGCEIIGVMTTVVDPIIPTIELCTPDSTPTAPKASACARQDLMMSFYDLVRRRVSFYTCLCRSLHLPDYEWQLAPNTTSGIIVPA